MSADPISALSRIDFGSRRVDAWTTQVTSGAPISVVNTPSLASDSA